MKTKTSVCLLGVYLLIVSINLSGISAAHERPHEPGEPVVTFDLRHAPEAYDRTWIEQAHALYVERHAGSLDPAHVALFILALLFLAACILVGDRLNGLDRHLDAFSDNQFTAALRLWMLRRWGSRA